MKQALGDGLGAGLGLIAEGLGDACDVASTYVDSHAPVAPHTLKGPLLAADSTGMYPRFEETTSARISDDARAEPRRFDSVIASFSRLISLVLSNVLYSMQPGVVASLDNPCCSLATMSASIAATVFGPKESANV